MSGECPAVEGKRGVSARAAFAPRPARPCARRRGCGEMLGWDDLYPLPVPPSWVPGAAVGILSLHFVQKLLFPYFWADLRYLLKVMTYGLRMEMYRLQGRVVTVLDKFVKLAEKQPHKPFLIYEGTVHTYRDVDRRSNRIAQVFLQHEALKKGDTVALLMGNEPDFIHVWFGLAKLGCVVAFLNFNVRFRSLLHCVSSCEPKILVVGAGRVYSSFLHPKLLMFIGNVVYRCNEKKQRMKETQGWRRLQDVIKHQPLRQNQ